MGSIEGTRQFAYRAVADALEVIPRTLAHNCGADVVRIMTDLRARHAAANGGNWGRRDGPRDHRSVCSERTSPADGCRGSCNAPSDRRHNFRYQQEEERRWWWSTGTRRGTG